MRLAIAPIVEGHGEVGSARILLQRISEHLSPESYVEVLRPLRLSRGKLDQEVEVSRSVVLASNKLRAAPADVRLVLIMFDADAECAANLGPKVASWARAACGDIDVECAIACVEYETWFVASAESLTDILRVDPDGVPADPERDRAGKGWVQSRMSTGRYSETVDQPKLTARIDVDRCAARSPSFARLVKKVSDRLRGQGRSSTT